jgi:hypothetical protein
MLALTVKDPWAWAIFHAGKDFENRDWPWPTSIALPCRILIHTSKYVTRDEYRFAVACIWEVSGREPPAIQDISRGLIIGAATVTRCVTDDDSVWFGGVYGFALERAVLLPRPIGCAGARRLWTVPRDVELQVREAAKEITQ